jgi:Tol biopolymer transport system component
MRARLQTTPSPRVVMRLTALFALWALVACNDVGPSLPAAVSEPRYGVSSGDGLQGRIAFHRGATFNGDFEIYVMNADGSNITQVTHNDVNEFDPIWSPNGMRLAFGRCQATCDVVVINADGSGERVLINDGFPSAWSPDGKRIAFTGFRDGDDEVFIMNADGSGVTQVTNNGFHDSPTDWSPDGKQLLFQSDRDGNTELYVMNVDGSGVTRLTNNPASDEGDRAGWSPDGKKIVFSSRRDGDDLDIFIMNSDGTGVIQLTKNEFVEDDDPVWSPDGKHIAFQSTRDGDEEILVMNPDGTNLTQLTFNEGIFDAVPAWTGGAITSPTTQSHFVANGDFASLSWFESDPAGGFTFGSLSVSRGGPTNAPQTFLSYFVFQCDPFGSCIDVRDGFGLIPNNDLSGGSKSLSLRTNTSGNPNFVTFAGPTGPVSVDWRANGLFTQSASGTNQVSFPGFTQKSQGGSTSASANAAGSIVGAAISPNGSAGIGTNYQVTIDITRTSTLGVAAWTLTADGSGQPALTSIGGSVPLLMVGTTSTATQFHFVANGDLGSVSWFDPSPAGGFTFGSLSVSRGGPTTDPQTFLSYFVFECDATFSCSVTRDGFGLIPNGDLSGGRTSLRLSTNTTGNQNFVTSAGPTGVVSVDWRANGMFTQSSSGTSQLSFPGFTQRFQGSSTSASANATGGIVGAPISPNGSAAIGTNHQVLIDITH